MNETFNDNNQQFIQQFITETEEHLETIENSILIFEKNISNKEEFDEETINEIFRAVHTIKGVSGMLDFEEIFGLTHRWETLLDKIRKKKLTLNTEIIDTSFECLDILTKQLKLIKETGTDKGILLELIFERLEEHISEKTVKKTKDKKYKEKSFKDDKVLSKLSPVVQKAITKDDKQKLIQFINKKLNVYEVKLFLNKDCFDNDISYLSTCINLELIGEIVNVYCNIDAIPTLEKFDPETYDLELLILFATDKDYNAIAKILRSSELRVTLLDFNENIKEEEIKEEVVESHEIEEQKEIIFSKPKQEIQKNPIPTTFKEPINAEIKKASTLEPQKIKEENVIESHLKGKILSQETIRVETVRLDTLLDLLGEQVISKTQLEHISNELSNLVKDKEHMSNNKDKFLKLSEHFNEIITSFSNLSNELQDIVMRIRMVPIGNVFNRFNRLVRDLSKELGKEVDLIIEGEETELDKTIVEEISDPLVHIIRNALDHGIEIPEERIKLGKPPVGKLHLNSYQQSNSIVITIKDDGKGLDLKNIRKKAIEKGIIYEDSDISNNELVNLIFSPGFSTSERVTSTSGRGVGMDVVKKNVTNLKGTIDIETKEGEGSTFVIKLPLTLAIIQALLIQVSGHVFAIPLSSVIESYRANPDEIKLVNNKPVLKLRDRLLPILYFEDYFKLKRTTEKRKHFYIVVMGIAENRVGFVVDKLIGQQEIVIKSLKDPLVRIEGIAGATLLGDGVTLIIDVLPIILSNLQHTKKTYKMAF